MEAESSEEILERSDDAPPPPPPSGVPAPPPELNEEQRDLYHSVVEHALHYGPGAQRSELLVRLLDGLPSGLSDTAEIILDYCPPRLPVFSVDSAGGTGKTFCVSKIISAIKKIDASYKFLCMAPTHAAKRVLKDTGIPGTVTTVYAKDGLCVHFKKASGSYNHSRYNDHPDLKRADYAIDPRPLTFSKQVVIFDEISMFPKSLAARIIDSLFLKPGVLRSSIKAIVIFLGDSAQLPAVGSRGVESSMYYYLNRFLPFNRHMKLTKNVRSKTMDAVFQDYLLKLRGRILDIASGDDRRVYDRPFLSRELMDLAERSSSVTKWSSNELRDNIVSMHEDRHDFIFCAYSHKKRNETAALVRHLLRKGDDVVNLDAMNVPAGKKFGCTSESRIEFFRKAHRFYFCSEVTREKKRIPVTGAVVDILSGEVTTDSSWWIECGCDPVVIDAKLLLHADGIAKVRQAKFINKSQANDCDACRVERKKIDARRDAMCGVHEDRRKRLSEYLFSDPRFSTVYAVQGKSTETLVLNWQNVLFCVQRHRNIGDTSEEDITSVSSRLHPSLPVLYENLKKKCSRVFVPGGITPALVVSSLLLKALYVAVSRARKKLVLVCGYAIKPTVMN
jgi:hypothetical protein